MLAEDLTLFLDVDLGFAQVVTLAGASVNAIFDNGYTLGDVGLVGMADAKPSLTLATADVPASPYGATVVVASVNYLVAAHEPDGTGLSKLLLELAS